MINNTQHELVPFQWGQIDLKEVVYIDGIPHPTKRSMGEWLEYGDQRVSINNILTRNDYIEAWGTDIKLISVDGKKRDHRVYHPVGFQLIVMESGQPKAIQYKTAVALFVFHFVFGGGLTHDQRLKYKAHYLKACAALTSATDHFTKELILADIFDTCITLGARVPDIRRIGEAFNPEQLSLAFQKQLQSPTTH